MSKDCCFITETNWFRYRTGGFLIDDGRVLFIKSRFGGYLYMIGGGVHMSETSVASIEREFVEETGITVRAERLAVVCENFFRGDSGTIENRDCHTIEFYYILKAEKSKIEKCRSYADSGEELVWVPIEDIPDSFIKPSFIQERIEEIINSDRIIHIIEDRDR